jgi:hypothetical protein
MDMPTPDQYRRTARDIARYLAQRQQPDGAFPGPHHYGLAFALWLWSALGSEFDDHARLALTRLQTQPPRTHGEFNAYALMHCRARLAPVDPLVRRLRFGRRHSANWMLLRASCRALAGSRCARIRGLLEARAALLRHARHGFIADRGGVRSFAYHAFSGALLAGLWQVTGRRWPAIAALRAAHAIAPFILPNGDALYLGRGQEQIFGYGALLNLLEAAARLSGRAEFRAHADRVYRHLLRFQRPDGSFPLVLREGEPAEPWSPEPLPGWYSYNRYADYLPFLGCMLLQAAAPNWAPLTLLPEGVSPPHPDFRLHRTARYVAVISCPGGVSTNDLAFPYLCVDGASLFPCYGSEGRVAPEAMPLPYGVLSDGRAYGFRDRLRYRLTEAALAGISSLAAHTRTFEFGPQGFVCRDEIAFRRRCSFSPFVAANFLFRNLRELPDGTFETRFDGARAVLRLHLTGNIIPDVAVTASGLLSALRHLRPAFRASPGDRLSSQLTVHFP